MILETIEEQMPAIKEQLKEQGHTLNTSMVFKEGPAARETSAGGPCKVDEVRSYWFKSAGKRMKTTTEVMQIKVGVGQW